MITPPIETTGIWDLAAPFNGKLLSTQNGVSINKIPYTLIAIRKLSDILASGGDPETDYYVANSLDHTRYVADFTANVAILTLQGGSGDIVYVPSSFVNNYPDIGGVPYTVLALAINIGAIPDSLDLTHIKTRITGVVLETLGIDSLVNTVAISSKTLLPNIDADVIESARLAKILIAETDYARALRAEAERDSARARAIELEAFIVANKAKLLLI